MFICDNPKFVYVSFTKSGSSSMYALFNQHYAGLNKPRHHRKIPDEYSIYPSFTVVRNPYSRMVSWWWSICKVGGDRYGHRKELAQAGLTESLADFCTLWSTKPESATSQSFIIENVNDFDCVLKLENIEEDFNALPFVATHIEIPKANVKNKPHWKDLITPEAIKVINQHWENDFTLLNYEILK